MNVILMSTQLSCHLCCSTFWLSISEMSVHTCLFHSIWLGLTPAKSSLAKWVECRVWKLRAYDFHELVDCASIVNKLAEIKYSDIGLKFDRAHNKRCSIWAELHIRWNQGKNRPILLTSYSDLAFDCRSTSYWRWERAWRRHNRCWTLGGSVC